MAKSDASAGTITSLDGSRTLSLEEFDRLAEEGSDEIDAFFDWSKAYRAGHAPGTGRLALELTLDEIDLLHAEADRRGVGRDVLLQEWVREHLRSLDGSPSSHRTAAE